MKHGSLVNMIDDHSLFAIPIPLLKCKRTQEEINILALKANQMRNKPYKYWTKRLSIQNPDEKRPSLAFFRVRKVCIADFSHTTQAAPAALPG